MRSIIELKAGSDGLGNVRSKSLQLGARYIGSYHQVDTYFRVPQGKLKIRETEGQISADIIFYERPNVPKIKKSHILLTRVQPGDTAKELLARFLPIEAVVDKIREIYILEETRIHLDQVKLLGTFIEFERPTTDEASEIEGSRSILADLCMKLDVKEEDLEALSYADLLLGKGKKCRIEEGNYIEMNSDELIKLQIECPSSGF